MMKAESEEAIVLDSALRIARSWPVFPVFHWDAMTGMCSCGNPDCTRPAKHPKTRNGLSDATLDSTVVKRMFTNMANIGIRTGDGLMVLDVDTDKTER